MRTKPRPMAAAFIIRDGRLLLVHNIKHGLRIEPPGGKVHDGETYENACIREAREELGVEIAIEDVFSTHRIATPEGPFDVRLFRCAIVTGEPQNDLEPGKIGGFQWYTFSELEQLAAKGVLVPDVVETLPRLRAILP